MKYKIYETNSSALAPIRPEQYWEEDREQLTLVRFKPYETFDTAEEACRCIDQEGVPHREYHIIPFFCKETE